MQGYDVFVAGGGMSGSAVANSIPVTTRWIATAPPAAESRRR